MFISSLILEVTLNIYANSNWTKKKPKKKTDEWYLLREKKIYTRSTDIHPGSCKIVSLIKGIWDDISFSKEQKRKATYRQLHVSASKMQTGY